MRRALALAFVSLSWTTVATAEGDMNRGAQLYPRACAACHSLEENRNLTGPSLAHLWGGKAGALESFKRYSPALKGSGVVWSDQTLNNWLADPAHFIPGNRMTFAGLKDDQMRADMIAYLKQATASGKEARGAGMQMGGMGGQAPPNLKQLGADDRVEAITYCGDTYRVTTSDGQVHEFWERNLRFKTDSSPEGPNKGAPAIVGAGMMGDRASVIFAAADEIASFVKPGC